MRGQKYGSHKTTVNGIKFASKLEAERYRQLRLLEKCDPPLISDLVLQPEFQIIQGYVDPETGEKVKSTHYVADFQYVDLETNKIIVEDTKGIETDTFKIKWKLVRMQYRDREFRMLKRKDI